MAKKKLALNKTEKCDQRLVALIGKTDMANVIQFGNERGISKMSEVGRVIVQEFFKNK